LTWATGVLDQNYNFHFKRNDEFIFADANTMIRDHYPFDPIWQLNPNPVTLQQFRAHKASGTTPVWNYSDTINHFLELNDQEAILEGKSRALRFDPKNGYAKADLGYYYLSQGYQILNIHQDRIKKARRDKTLLTNEPKLHAELDKAQKLISSAQNVVRKIDYNGDQQLRSYITETRSSCKDGFDYIKKQRKWLKKYFKDPRPIQ
jgi:hypothetical protein